jgi:hypothetical protein
MLASLADGDLRVNQSCVIFWVYAGGPWDFDVSMPGNLYDFGVMRVEPYVHQVVEP